MNELLSILGAVIRSILSIFAVKTLTKNSAFSQNLIGHIFYEKGNI